MDPFLYQNGNIQTKEPGDKSNFMGILNDLAECLKITISQNYAGLILFLGANFCRQINIHVLFDKSTRIPGFKFFFDNRDFFFII